MNIRWLVAPAAASVLLWGSIPAQAAKCGGGGHSSYKRSSYNTAQPSRYTTARTNVYRWLAENPDYSDWYSAVYYAGLDKDWMGDKGWTVFVPSNEAIANLPDGVWATLTQPENRALLSEVVRYHVVNQPYTTRQWAGNRMVKFWNGDEWAFTTASDGRYMVGNGYIVDPDITVGRSRVNVVDTVYLPMNVINRLEDRGYALTAWYPDARGGVVMSSTRRNYDTDNNSAGTYQVTTYQDVRDSAMDRAGDDLNYSQDPWPVLTTTRETTTYPGGTVTVYNWFDRQPEYRTWWQAMDTAGVATTLKGSTQYTVFVPSDDAIAALPDGVWDTVMSDKALLRQVVNYNLVRGSYDPMYFTDGRHRVYSVYGESPRYIMADDGTFMVGPARVMGDAYVAANGRVYTVDRVLFPRTVLDTLHSRGYNVTAWYDADGAVRTSSRQHSGTYSDGYNSKRHYKRGRCH